MKIRLQGMSAMLICMFLVASCTKERTKLEDPPRAKVAKLVRRDFTKGIMTVTYDDGYQEVSCIPIDSSAFKRKDQANAKSGDVESYMFGEESEHSAPIYDPDLGYFVTQNFSWGTGPAIKTAAHCVVQSLDGIIVGYRDPWVEITKNKSVYFKYKNPLLSDKNRVKNGCNPFLIRITA
jgi:hypothetical protein